PAAREGSGEGYDAAHRGNPGGTSLHTFHTGDTCTRKDCSSVLGVRGAVHNADAGVRARLAWPWRKRLRHHAHGGGSRRSRWSAVPCFIGATGTARAAAAGVVAIVRRAAVDPGRSTNSVAGCRGAVLRGHGNDPQQRDHEWHASNAIARCVPRAGDVSLFLRVHRVLTARLVRWGSDRALGWRGGGHCGGWSGDADVCELGVQDPAGAAATLISVLLR